MTAHSIHYTVTIIRSFFRTKQDEIKALLLSVGEVERDGKKFEVSIMPDAGRNVDKIRLELGETRVPWKIEPRGAPDKNAKIPEAELVCTIDFDRKGRPMATAWAPIQYWKRSDPTPLTHAEKQLKQRKEGPIGDGKIERLEGTATERVFRSFADLEMPQDGSGSEKTVPQAAIAPEPEATSATLQDFGITPENYKRNNEKKIVFRVLKNGIPVDQGSGSLASLVKKQVKGQASFIGRDMVVQAIDKEGNWKKFRANPIEQLTVAELQVKVAPKKTKGVSALKVAMVVAAMTAV